ncbi:MAG TPA: PCRF domain-containing protein, partial [Candidatus Krumholzibacterium sp.]|nr:PCRF domain-containing protein [Candidatus Krumholzibacterium sp.]
MTNEIGAIEEKMSVPNFWNDREGAEKLVSRMKSLKNLIDPYTRISGELESVRELIALNRDEADDSLLEEIVREMEGIEERVNDFELSVLLSGDHDRGNAIMNIHPGAGGTESQDWAEMLLRLYTRYLDRQGYSYKLLDLQPGDEAGIKNATVEVKGELAYGRLKSEGGIHRLVRISPFDANHRRHTSFASVFVYPEIEEDIEVEINPDDIRVDT